MGWLFDLFNTKHFGHNDGELILCEIYRRRKEGALTMYEVTKDMNIVLPKRRYHFLESYGYIRPWMMHGKERSYLITRKGILRTMEIKGIKGTDGEPILKDHLGDDSIF